MNGNLFNFMKNRNETSLDQQIVARIYIQICEAVKFLHDNNIIHRDIKPENILLDGNLNAKLCDFGWSTEAQRNEARQTFCGTYEYMAPEIFESEEYNGSVDIWSLGILLYEMLHGKSPFAGTSVFKIFKNILKEDIKFKRDIDPNAADLILRILKTDATKRPDIEYIMNHPYIVSHKKINLIEDDKESDSDLDGDYEEVINIVRGSTDNSHCSDDEYLEQELRDFVAIDLKIIDDNDSPSGELRATKKEFTKLKNMDMSFKISSPVIAQTSTMNKMAKFTSTDSLNKPKEKSLLLPLRSKAKYEISPQKHKKNLSITHGDRDLAQFYRMKTKSKMINHSEKRLETKTITSGRDVSFGNRKVSQPQSLKNFFKSKIEEFVFHKGAENNEKTHNDSTNIYKKQRDEKSHMNSALYEDRPKTPNYAYGTNSDVKIYQTSRPVKNNDVTPKVSKLKVVKSNNYTHINNTFIDVACKKFPTEHPNETQKEWSKDRLIYGSTDRLDTAQGSKRTLNNKQGLMNKKLSTRNPIKSSIQSSNKSNINIVINKFYDKAKVYCQTDDVSSSQKFSNSRKLSGQIVDCIKTKKSNKVLPELQPSKFL